MKLFISKELEEMKQIEDFLKISINDLTHFVENHLILIENCGIYIKRENYVLCLCAQRNKEVFLFILPCENFEEKFLEVAPTPIEYEWEDITNIS